MRTANKCIVLVFMLFGLSLTGSAATITYEDTATGVRSTWLDSLFFPLFDPSLGTLHEVQVELEGNVNGTIWMENMDGDVATLVGKLQAELGLYRPLPMSTLILQVIPLAQVTFDASAYDSVTDFGGTSGVTFANQSATLTDSVTLTSASDLALFTGVGTIELGGNSVGSSIATGPGDVASIFSAVSGMTAKITYVYDVPEPATMLLIGSSLIGVALLARKRFI